MDDEKDKAEDIPEATAEETVYAWDDTVSIGESMPPSEAIPGAKTP